MSRMLEYRVEYADQPQANLRGCYDGTSLAKDVPEWLLMPLFTFLPDPDFQSFRLVRGQTLLEIEAVERGHPDQTPSIAPYLIGSEPIVEDALPPELTPAELAEEIRRDQLAQAQRDQDREERYR